ncbi:MAG: PEP-CTERM sorting domain-containing protein [Pirellulales bacterium]|nr:PEP-CTERM sorting domain-containing protein [Pirellulales bacterium]
MVHQLKYSAWRAAAVLAMLSQCYPARAAVHDLAEEFDHTLTSNPDGNWAYGYLSSGSSSVSNDQFIISGNNNGFIVYDSTGPAGGGGGTGWTTGFGFPFTGVLRVPATEASVAPYDTGGLTDWPTAEGDDPNYPHGIIGGHGPTTSFLTGWYAVQYTADTSGLHDIEVRSWQTGTYPVTTAVGGADPLYGGNVRPHQMMITKGSGGSQTKLIVSPQVARHGYVNKTGMPVHTTDNAQTPGEPRSFATEQDEINAAIRSSIHPNLYRVTNLNLNAGETVVISLGAYFGDNQTGFNGFNAVVRTGANRVATTHWDLSDDWSVTGASATGIGPDAAWSFGVLKSGSFAPYDKTLFGRAENASTPERENHGWGTNAPGWFVAGAPEPETGPVVPGMVKDYSGFNMTKVTEGGVVTEINGDWSGDKVAIHTPPPDVDAAQTSVIRWTAPRAMSVDASGGMWRLTLPDGTDRRHEYKLLKNGAVLASGVIDELGFGPTDTNSANPEGFSLTSIAVAQGDRLELHIAPLSGGGSVTANFDGAGAVDAGDLAQWRGDFGVDAGSDADNDGDSDGNDFLAWQREFGMTGGGPAASPGFIGVDFTINASAAAAAVPEPACLALLGAGLTALTVARRRR